MDVIYSIDINIGIVYINVNRYIIYAIFYAIIDYLEKDKGRILLLQNI